MEEEFKAWMKRAEQDLEAAKYNLKGKFLNASIFYSQQSVEKALKALLIKKTKDFPKIHDLTRLAKLVNAPIKIIKLCSNINPGYILSRYPDQEEEYEREDAEKMIKNSMEVLKWIRENL